MSAVIQYLHYKRASMEFRFIGVSRSIRFILSAICFTLGTYLAIALIVNVGLPIYAFQKLFMIGKLPFVEVSGIVFAVVLFVAAAVAAPCYFVSAWLMWPPKKSHCTCS